MSVHEWLQVYFMLLDGEEVDKKGKYKSLLLCSFFRNSFNWLISKWINKLQEIDQFF